VVVKDATPWILGAVLLVALGMVFYTVSKATKTTWGTVIGGAVELITGGS